MVPMMTTNQRIDVLREDGFFVGPRDPEVMPGDPGQFMVLDQQDPTDYPYCVVGDDLDVLVSQVWNDCGYDVQEQRESEQGR